MLTIAPIHVQRMCHVKNTNHASPTSPFTVYFYSLTSWCVQQLSPPPSTIFNCSHRWKDKYASPTTILNRGRHWGSCKNCKNRKKKKKNGGVCAHHLLISDTCPFLDVDQIRSNINRWFHAQTHAYRYHVSPAPVVVVVVLTTEKTVQFRIESIRFWNKNKGTRLSHSAMHAIHIDIFSPIVIVRWNWLYHHWTIDNFCSRLDSKIDNKCQ